MNNRKITFSLIVLYLLPWGIQCLVNNLIPVYVKSLSFATDKTVGLVTGLGAVITVFSQLIWTYFAGKSKNKSNVLALSLLLLTAFSLLFLKKNISQAELFIFVVLFYSCYMVHQPLVDTIASENYTKTKYMFGFFRSFASFGYAVMGLVFAILPNENPSVFFLYTAILASLSLIVSKTIDCRTQEKTAEKKDKNIFNSVFIRFLVYTFILYVCSSSILSYFSVYYTSKDALGGNVGTFTLLISIAAFAEWALVILYSKFTEKIKWKYTFMMIAASGILRSFTIFIAPTPFVASLSLIFNTIWFGLLGPSVALYIKKNVSVTGNAFAQGVWTVVSSGVGTFTGSFLSGLFVGSFGLKTLFLAVAILLTILTLITPVLIQD